MRVLWVVNIMLPDIARALNKEFSVREGWLSGIFSKARDLSEKDLEHFIAYPYDGKDLPEKIIVNDIPCFSFYEDLKNPHIYEDALQTEIKGIIDIVKPDILHIFGTEFPHCLAAVRAFNNADRTLIGIQGLCGAIAKDYYALLPENIINKSSLRDILRKDSIKNQRDKFLIRAEHENEAIRGAGHITGRTLFDKEETEKINPARIYHKMNETMREEFYLGKWDLNNAHFHSIFIGQADYPIKGFHFLIEAAGALKEKYPDLRITVAGNSIINAHTLKERLKLPEYGIYLRGLIKKYNLDGCIRVTGMLTASRIKEEYLKSAVFVCPSYVENSPNTLAEAMLLGMPVVASDAGGIGSMLSDKEGLIFKRGDTEALKYAIDKVFTLEDNKDEALNKMCEASYERAHTSHNGEANFKRLLEIYGEII